MGGTYSMHEEDSKSIQNFSLNTWRNETTWDI